MFVKTLLNLRSIYYNQIDTRTVGAVLLTLGNGENFSTCRNGSYISLGDKMKDFSAGKEFKST